MVDNMDHDYRAHGHQRSLSSLASSILPIPSDTSTVTSITPSPLDVHDSQNLPIELKIPLPLSSPPSHHEAEGGRGEKEGDWKPTAAIPGNENKDQKSEAAPDDPTTKQPQTSSASIEEPLPKSVPWDTLTRVTKEEHHEKWRLERLQEEVKRLRLHNGLHRRLGDTLAIGYGNLIDQFKGDDQAGFTGLFEASERLSAQCNSTNPEALTDKIPGVAEGSMTRSEGEESSSSLLQLTLDDQEAVVVFLNKLRTDLDYLADLICMLPPVELASLTSCYHPAGVDLSILPNHSHGRTQVYSRDSQMMKLSRRMDNIDLFHRKDPYFALLYIVFDSSATTGSKEYQLKQEIWARTCARVMTQGQIGSEEFAIGTIDSFVSTTRWDLKPEIELYLLQLLAEGWFILDPPTEETVERAGSMIEPERASHAIAVAEFFDRHTRKLFTLLATESRTAVPEDVIHFIHVTLSHIEDRQMRELAKKFIVSRWYFASFLTSLLVYPEVRGLCVGHHIGQSARQRILNHLALQLQSQVFSVLAPSSSVTFIPPEVRDQVFRIVEFFDPPVSIRVPQGDSDDATVSWNRQLMMSPWDIIALVETLHPTAEAARQQSLSASSQSPSSKASSTTLRPEKIGPSKTEPRIGSNYAESASTDGTFVEDLSPQSQSDRQEHGHDTGPSGDKAVNNGPTIGDRLQRLTGVVDRLRSFTKALTRPNADSSAPEWIFFRVSPEDLTLKLAPGSSDSAPTKLFAHAEDIGLHVSLQESQDYQVVRGTIHSLLSMSPSTQLAIPSSVSEPSSRSVAHLVEARLAEAKARHHFLDAHDWWRKLMACRDLEKTKRLEVVYSALSREIFKTSQAQCLELRQQSSTLETLVAQLDAQRNHQQHVLEDLTDLRKELRVKMWYASDIKHSAPYEDALRVTKALRAMANPKKVRQQGGLAHWARQRLRGTTPYDRADKQALEAMCAPQDQGGLPKLADDQLDMTSRWMTKNSVENFCKGEERVHRFHHEVQKLVNKLAGMSLMESPVLWSSNFFRREKTVFDAQSRRPNLFASIGSPLSPLNRHQDPSPLRSPFGGGMTAGATDPRMKPLDFSSGLQITNFPDEQPGHPTASGAVRSPYSSLPASHALGYLSPPMTPLSPKTAEGFSTSIPGRIAPIPKAKIDFVENLRKRLLALVSSDLGYMLWALGSETDIWTQKAMAREQNSHAQLCDKFPPSSKETLPKDGHEAAQLETNAPHRPSEGMAESHAADDHKQNLEISSTSALFSYSEAYSTIMHIFSRSKDPYKKLQMLSQLEDLVISSLQDNPSSPSSYPHKPFELKPPRTLSKDTPRTKATSLEEVVANCSERRASTLRHTQPRPPIPQSFLTSSISSTSTTIATPDTIISTLLTLFRDPSLRPSHLFLDLQQIASLIPSKILDHTPQGRAFWDTALAAMALKEELTTSTITRASAITEYHLSLTAKHPPLLFTPSPNAHSHDKDKINENDSWLTSTALKDAAQLWLIAAKEGSPEAARELALFYLTHPNLIRRTTAPMSKGRDIFGTTGMRAQGGALDPRTFSVVLHWMEVAASGGDREAGEFLRENGGGGQ